MLKNILLKFSLSLCLLLAAGTLYAKPGLFFDVKATGTPDHVNIILCLNGKGAERGAGSCQHYTVSALNLFVRTVIPNHLYLAGIKILTPGYTIAGLGITCTPYKNGYCLFYVSDTLVRNIPLQKQQVSLFTVGGSVSNLQTNGLILQNNGTDNLIVTPGATSFVFPTPLPTGSNYNVTILQEPTGFYCTVSNGSGTVGLSNVTNISVQCHPSLAYFTNYTPVNGVTVCPLDALGQLLPCAPPVDPGATFSTPTGLTISNARNHLYITNFGNNSVSVCNLDSSGALTSCVAQGTITDFVSPIGISLNMTDTMAYISNSGANTISQCLVNTNGLLILPCTAFINSFSNPHATTINQSNNRLYIVSTNFNNPSSVNTCNADSTGFLIPGTCQASVPFGSGLVGIAVNNLETMAYVTSFSNNSVYICNITAGVVNSCANSGQTFSGPEYIALNSANTRAYVANFNNNTASVCDIGPTGNFTACTDTAGIPSPYGVTVTN